MSKVSTNCFEEFSRKMLAAGVNTAAIKAFRHNYDNLLAGETGMIPESTIQAVDELPRFEQIASSTAPQRELLSRAVMVKLNGGLGTSMGLEKAKSLLEVKNGLTFLDLILLQVRSARQHGGNQLRFLLMNSFNTSRDTTEFLRQRPEIGDPKELELLQSQAPKVDAESLRPVSWPENSHLEWCPPGHGDFYPCLWASGKIDRWIKDGVRYLFISNSDNLGASLEPALLSYFATSGKPFLMEVAERTASDRKGGHLATRGARFVLRESAQCLQQDEAAFQDISRHRFFNTNNLWIRLDSLKAELEANQGFIPLPLIKNSKTVNPRDKTSRRVYQLETAMGAAIGSFANAGAIVVPRSRFAPVKTTSDLLALRSDAYEVTEDGRIILTKASERAPIINLDDDHYKLVDQLDASLASGVPSLRQCAELTVKGPVVFSSKNVFIGRVSLRNKSATPKALPDGTYTDSSIEL